METDTLYAEGVLGADAESFIKSELGRVVMGLAHESAQDAYRQLKDCDPSDAKLIAKLQGYIWRAESFEQWLTELIIAGEQAIHTLEEQSK